MKGNRLVALSITAACLSLTLFAVADVPSESSSKRIAELHSQKLEVLQDIVDRYQFGYSKGKPVLEEMLAAEHELLLARLDLAKSRQDFIALRELLLENRIRLVEARVAGAKIGTVAEVAILTARVQKIDAEIDLEHERSNGHFERQKE